MKQLSLDVFDLTSVIWYLKHSCYNQMLHAGIALDIFKILNFGLFIVQNIFLRRIFPKRLTQSLVQSFVICALLIIQIQFEQFRDLIENFLFGTFVSWKLNKGFCDHVFLGSCAFILQLHRIACFINSLLFFLNFFGSRMFGRDATLRFLFIFFSFFVFCQLLIAT